MTQEQAVIETIRQLGGVATLTQINHNIFSVTDCQWKAKNPFASIRAIVQRAPKYWITKPTMSASSDYSELYFRGFNSQYGVFDNKENTSYSWVTQNPQYALQYARTPYNMLAVVKLCSSKIGCISDLPDGADYYAPTEKDMQALYQQGFDGYGFYANDDTTYCLCVRKTVLQIQSLIGKDRLTNKIQSV